jgi:hypothetical protein
MPQGSLKLVRLPDNDQLTPALQVSLVLLNSSSSTLQKVCGWITHPWTVLFTECLPLSVYGEVPPALGNQHAITDRGPSGY